MIFKYGELRKRSLAYIVAYLFPGSTVSTLKKNATEYYAYIHLSPKLLAAYGDAVGKPNKECYNKLGNYLSFVVPKFKSFVALGSTYPSTPMFLNKVFSSGMEMVPIDTPVTVKELTKVGWLNLDNPPIDAPALTGETKQLKYAGRRDLYSAVFTYYAIEEFTAFNEDIEVQKRKKAYVSIIARNMFDYLAAIAFVEARHAKGTKWNCYDGDMSRESAQKYVCYYDPRQFLPIVKQVHETEECWGDGGFGGKPWAKITDFAMRYFTMPTGAWFDHVIDLSHHGGLAFNKGYIWYPPDESTYRDLLDIKSKSSVFNLPFKVGLDTKELRWLAWVLAGGDPPEKKCQYIDWGNKVLKVSLNSDFVDEDNENEETEEEEEDETNHNEQAKWRRERIKVVRR